MRGRTLNDSFVILDEAQNTTGEQMKMFLTRLGYGSKAVITGDVTQIDLPAGKLVRAEGSAASILAGIDGIRFCDFTERDVVRHRLVQDIITAYDRFEAAAAQRRRVREGREWDRVSALRVGDVESLRTRASVRRACVGRCASVCLQALREPRRRAERHARR